MRSGQQPVRLALVPALAALLLFGFQTGAAQAAAKRRPPPAPPPGLTVDVARIEPLEPDAAVRLEGKPDYRGILELRRTAAGIGAVNEVPFEEYLKGIAEMPSGWPAEAQRAQAIAARTYALWVMQAGPAGEAAGLRAQICATEGCQVYAGLEKAAGAGGGNWAAAVEATRGQALLYQGKPILAKYSSSNGGRSASGGRPYLKAVDDPDDAKSPLHRWQLTISFDDLGRALAAPGRVVGAGRDGGGDVVVDWAGPDGGGQLTVPASDLRAKVNGAVPPPPGRSRTVPSPFFSLRADAGARMAVLEGRGYGHAIGMSQYGAYGKALRGLKASAILAAYYGGIKPTTLPADRLPATVRVAVDPGRPEALAGASTPFRILDGKGRVVAHIASGTWRAVPGAKGGVRLLPPPGQSGPPGVHVLGVEPPAPQPGQAVTVRFRPTVPAVVRVVAQPPGGVEFEALAPRPAGTGEATVTLPGAAQAGSYFVSISVDAGAGRSALQALAPQVVVPAGPAAAAAGDDRRFTALGVRASRSFGERTAAPAGGPASPSAAAVAGVAAAVALAGGSAGWRLGQRPRRGRRRAIRRS